MVIAGTVDEPVIETRTVGTKEAERRGRHRKDGNREAKSQRSRKIRRSLDKTIKGNRQRRQIPQTKKTNLTASGLPSYHLAMTPRPLTLGQSAATTTEQSLYLP